MINRFWKEFVQCEQHMFNQFHKFVECVCEQFWSLTLSSRPKKELFLNELNELNLKNLICSKFKINNLFVIGSKLELLNSRN